jgi:hypothetical protein
VTVLSQFGAGATNGSDVEGASDGVGGSGGVRVHPIKETPSMDRTMPALSVGERYFIFLSSGAAGCEFEAARCCESCHLFLNRGVDTDQTAAFAALFPGLTFFLFRITGRGRGGSGGVARSPHVLE